MGGYYLCEVKKADRPYRIDGIGIDIYTIEELCFYLRQNVYLIDDSIINEELCDWINSELRLPGLARKLKGKLKRKENAVEFIMPIFREIGYLTREEYRQVTQQIAGALVQPEDQRRKLKADHMIAHGVYSGAIHEYYRILRTRSQGSVGAKFFASVLNNMAVAYTRMFLFEEAADCLWQSYGIVRSGETWRRYLALLPLFLDEAECQKRVDELMVAPEQQHKIGQRRIEIVQQKLPEKQEAAAAEDYWQKEVVRYRRGTKF